MEKPSFPLPIRPNGRKGERMYFRRSEVEAYKCALAGIAPPKLEGPDTLVPTPQLARELGWNRRTVGRRIRESEAANG
jgi:hypothetical protein